MAVDTRGSDEIAVTPVVHPYAIVVSQDCDLEWDWDRRKSEDERDGIAAKLMSSVLFVKLRAPRWPETLPG